MSGHNNAWALVCATCMLMYTATAKADSIAMSGTITPSTNYYFGFDREMIGDDGGVMDGAGTGGTLVTVAGSTSEDQRGLFLSDPAIIGRASGIEDFETATANPDGSIPLSFGTTGLNGVAEPIGTGLTQISGDGHRAGRYPTSGEFFVDTDVTGSDTELTVTFSQPVAGFGFYATDSGDFDGQLRIIISRVGTGDVEFTLPSPTTIPDESIDRSAVPDDVPIYNASLLFLGLVDVQNPITAVTLINVPDGMYYNDPAGSKYNYDDDDYGFDDFIAVSTVPAVPEPASFGLLLLGGTALLGYSRRRTHREAA